MLAIIFGAIARSLNMSFRVSFGLAEILGIFGCYGLVVSNYAVGSILLALAVFGAFMRFALEQQSKKENNQKIEDIANTVKDALLTPSTWAGLSNKNTH
jgi:hypothetical protein